MRTEKEIREEIERRISRKKTIMTFGSLRANTSWIKCLLWVLDLNMEGWMQSNKITPEEPVNQEKLEKLREALKDG